VVEDALREQILVVTLAGMKATERPEMAEMQSGKDTPVAKFAIGQYLWKEPVNQCIQLDCRHSAFLLLTHMGIIAHVIIKISTE
jgi:hypothetical protein